MSRGWTLPAAAVAFWAGLLLWTVAPPWAQPWMGLAVGASALAGAALLSPPMAVGPRPLERLGLTAAEPASVRAVAARRPTPARSAPLAAAALLVLGLVALAAGWGGVHELRLDTSLLARVAPAGIEAQGSFRTDPSVGGYGWSAVVDLSSVLAGGRTWSVHESVWVSGDGQPPVAVRGDRISVQGLLQVPDDPGFATSLRHRGIVAELAVNRFARLGGASNPFLRATQVFRAFVGRSISRLFPPKEAGLLMGLALGDDSHLDPSLARDFQATGLGHLLVVSGENVAMVLGPMLGFAMLLRLRRWPRFLVGLGTVVFFVVLTGAEPSVMRAGVMATLTLVGVLAGRPRSTGSILAAAVLFLLALDPWLVWAIGFQLSVAATAGMVALASPLAERMRFLPKPVALAAGTTLAAQLGVTPILLFHFHEVPGVTILANLAAFPAVSPALLLGLLAAAIGLVCMPLGRVVAGLALMPMRYLEGVADRLAKAPVGWITSGGGPLVLLIGGAAVVAIAMRLRRPEEGRRRLSRPAIVAIGLVLPLFVWSTALSSGPPSGLTVRFFDVGQGDAALLTTPEGATMLVDGGPDPEQVATYLASVGVKRLDVVVATHPHADHIIGLPAVLARYRVGLVLEPGCPETSSIQADLDTAIGDEHDPVQYPRAGATFDVGSLHLLVLSPDRCWTGTNSDPNNDSLVILATYREDTVLFGGEPEGPAQQLLLDEHAPLHAEVLKVPHHGSSTSLPAFFPAVDPEIAVVSVGPNTYGHPVPAVLDEIRATGAAVYRTDRSGTITVTFGPRGPTVDSDR